MDLLIKSRTGINLSNIPGDVFQYLQNYSMNESGDITLSFDTGYYVTITTSIIQCYNTVLHRGETDYTTVTISSIGGFRVLDFPSDTIARVQADVRGEPDPQRIVMPPLQAQPQPTNVNEALDQLDQLVEQIDDNENELDEPESTSGVMKPSRYIRSSECDHDKEKVLISRAMRNRLSSSSNVIMEKVTALNQLMARTLVLQNEIKVLMEPLEESPKISFIMEKINEINQSVRADSVVNKAYINKDGDISIVTNRIYTEPLEDKTIRDIGELEIVISSLAILSETATTVNNPILIKNLTHYLRNNDGDWSCGHVRHEGDICFGNVFPQIHRALEDKNFMMVVELLIKFIRNPNVHDVWGRNILGFPVHGGQNS